MNLIIPAILAHDEKTFRERLKLVESLAPIVQIDVMDGAFVHNTTWCDFDALRQIQTVTTFELHLMVEDPETFIQKALTVPSITRLIWHVEAMGDHRDLLNLCHAHDREAGLAISPNTPADSLAPYIGRMDEILIMGVLPGFSGQQLIPDTIEKVRGIHARWPDVQLLIDGGVSPLTIPALRDAGATRFCAASALFGTDNVNLAFNMLGHA